MKKHNYQTLLEWTGNLGNGTKNYKSYSRDHCLTIEGKQHPVLGSSDPSFRGNPSRYNPEELFLASISNCHMLWYLHLCSVNDIVVLDYVDRATAIMEEDKTGSGHFTEVTLHPHVKVKDEEMIEKANGLHEKANQFCFIANSCNFTIKHEPKTEVIE
ncbi:MAG: OsmC family protein [Bacteroidota bacterium]